MNRFAVFVLALFFIGGVLCQKSLPERGLEVVFFDVGHGSAILVRSPDGHNCLIDGGPTFAGANRICPILDSLGITELDYTIATNYTEGRIGGLDEVIRYLGGEKGVLNQCYDRGRVLHTPAFFEYRQAAGKRRESMRVGQTITMGDVTITCLSRNGRILGSKLREPRVEEDRSIALRVSYGDFDLLIPGDLSAVTDDDRLDLCSELADACDEVELLAVGDYGSNLALNFKTLQQLNPLASVVSLGFNDESLPAQRTLSRLLSRHRKLYQTNGRTSESNPQITQAEPAKSAAGPAVVSGSRRFVNGNVWVTVSSRFFTVAGDTFRTFR